MASPTPKKLLRTQVSGLPCTIMPVEALERAIITNCSPRTPRQPRASRRSRCSTDTRTQLQQRITQLWYCLLYTSDAADDM
eukprot:2370800-Rhodomonas_salina.4